MTTIDEPSVRRYEPFGARATVGAARRDITPPVGIRARNWGAATQDRCTGVHRPILVNAVCFIDTAGESRYLVALDLVGLHDAPDQAIRPRVLAELGIDADHLLLHCVHTHAGPSTAPDEADLDGGDLIPAFLTAIVNGVVDACRQALGAAVPATITWGYGRCGLAAVRDLPTPRRDVCGFNPTIPADDTLAVGRITGSDGEPIAVLVNYACHATTLAWQNSLLSSDFVGAARETVEQATGGICVFLQGASGDLGPKQQYTGDTEVADANGRAVGYAALAAIATMPPPGSALAFAGVVESGAPLATWQPTPGEPSADEAWLRVDVDVPLKPEMTADEVARRWPSIDSVAAAERARRAQRLRAAYAGRSRTAHPVWIWQVGDGVIVAQPGEAYSLLQRELRRRHPGRVVIVMNLTNAPGGMYIPPADAYDHDRYQVWQTLYDRGSLETIIDGADGAISTLAPERTSSRV